MAGNDGAVSMFAVCLRLAQLNADGSISSGNALYVTDILTKITLAPVLESGDDLVIKKASGDLGAFYKHGDMSKRYDITLDVTAPDPELEQMVVGGTLLTDNVAALATPVAPTGVASASGGTLPTASDFYSVAAIGRYGQTIPSPISTAVSVTGPTGSVTVSWVAIPNAVGYSIYGRGATIAGQFLLATVTGQATVSWVDVGAPPIGGVGPIANNSAGPGTVGYAAPNLGIVGAPNGVSMEAWSRAIIGGNPATTGGGPYHRWVIPWARNFAHQPRDLSNTIVANSFRGEAYSNAKFGTGPRADWPLTSSQVWQRGRESQFPAPSVGIQVI